jgi:hypothetical protein
MTFEEFCKKQNTKLTKFQYALANDILETIQRRRLQETMKKTGSGVTTIFELVEKYFKESK